MAPSSGLAASLQLLPSGLVVPPLPYLAALGVSLAAVLWLLSARRPPVSQSLVAAFAPWMVAGAALHALEGVGAVPAVAGPLAAAPAVYVTTFVVAGAVWLLLDAVDPDAGTPTGLVAVGSAAALAPSLLVVRAGLARGTFSPVVPAVGLVASVLLAAVVYALLRRVRPETVATTGPLGPLVVFGHVLDGVSTAIGVDLLGAGERSPIPRAIMDVAGQLPTASVVGEGWLFVLVKLAVAVVVLDLFTGFVAEEPARGNVTLGAVAAVGLGPGAHNLLLFAALGAV